MTTQDNNEAASASQSSTAGAAKGGITKPTAYLATDLDGHGDVAFTEAEAKRRAGEHCTYIFPLFEECDLAHVARQRQESAAVAEGVDTALPPPALTVADEPGRGHYYTAEQMAQQREAGRRIGVAQAASAVRERATLDDGAQDEIFVETAVEAIEALVEAARPSVDLSKLTTYRCSTSGMLAAPSGEYYLASDVRALSAAPPAKAEGMSDSAIIGIMAQCGLSSGNITDYITFARAILAQQAKKGNQQ